MTLLVYLFKTKSLEMIARIFAALMRLLVVALPSTAQLVEIAVEPYVVHDGSIAELDGMTDLLMFLLVYSSECP